MYIHEWYNALCHYAYRANKNVAVQGEKLVHYLNGPSHHGVPGKLRYGTLVVGQSGHIHLSSGEGPHYHQYEACPYHVREFWLFGAH